MLSRPARLLCCLLPLLFGCAHPKPPPSLNGDQVIGLRLTEALVIPPRSATVRFQRGIQTSSVDRFNPYCEFEVNTVSEHPQTLFPDRFTLSGVDYRVVADNVTRLPLIMARDRSCDDPIYPETRFRLKSEKQPDVRSLSCLNVCIHCQTGCYYLWPEEISSILGSAFAWEVSRNEDRPPQKKHGGQR